MKNLRLAHVSPHGMICVQWETDDARYHVWVDRETLTISGSRTPGATIYKNSLVGHGKPGYFDTRKLDANAKAWRPTAEKIMKIVTRESVDAAVKAHEAAEIAETKRRWTESVSNTREKVRMELQAMARRDLADTFDTMTDKDFSRLAHAFGS